MKSRRVISIAAVLACVCGLLLGGAVADAGPAVQNPRSPVAQPQDIGRTNATIGRDYTQLDVPCRLYDSRHSSVLGTSLRTIPITACPGIPSYATSLNVSLGSAAAVHNGYMRIWANGLSEPTQTVLAYSTGTAITTGATVTVSATGLRVHNYGGPSHLIIDVAGYWSPLVYAEIYTGASSNVWSSTSMITSAALNVTGTAGAVRVTFKRSIRYCDVQASAESPTVLAAAVQFGQPENQAIVYASDRGTGNPVSVFVYLSVRC